MLPPSRADSYQFRHAPIITYQLFTHPPRMGRLASLKWLSLQLLTQPLGRFYRMIRHLPF